jgi:hypothetical protein
MKMGPQVNGRPSVGPYFQSSAVYFFDGSEGMMPPITLARL